MIVGFVTFESADQAKTAVKVGTPEDSFENF